MSARRTKHDAVNDLATEQAKRLDKASTLRDEAAFRYVGGALGDCQELGCEETATVLVIRPAGEDDEFWCASCAKREGLA